MALPRSFGAEVSGWGGRLSVDARAGVSSWSVCRATGVGCTPARWLPEPSPPPPPSRDRPQPPTATRSRTPTAMAASTGLLTEPPPPPAAACRDGDVRTERDADVRVDGAASGTV